MNKTTRERYEIWSKRKLKDDALAQELKAIAGNEEEINDRFYKELAFGTGGLRGVLGAGSNRINIYTISKASRGYAAYLLKNRSKPSIAIAYDSRINSDVFAEKAAEIMAAAGIEVYIWKELMPTPSLSFAVRYLHCDGGIVITASHNPAKYNGYKVYGNDGCQITLEAAEEIQKNINREEMFAEADYSYEQGIAEGKIHIIGEEVFDKYIEAVSKESLAPDTIDRNVKIAYTPLYGAGLRCVTECLQRNGFTDIEIVREQAVPNGNFPTCPYPNPEIREALEVGLKVSRESGAEILLATDPDCDRVGIALKSGDDYVLLSGNEVGLLLLDYICKLRKEYGKMPKDPICVKTIVTSDLAKKIAEEHGVELIEVLTGFKFIGEQIGILEKKLQEQRYIFGFEESYGYLSGSYVRDKDAVNGCLLIAEMFAFYKSKGSTLLKELEKIYTKYGYCLNTLHSFEFEGESGMLRMREIMGEVRSNPPKELLNKKIVRIFDYKESKEYNLCDKTENIITLPKSDVIKWIFEDNSSAVFRPSGTEPKLKVYLSISGEDKGTATEIERHMEAYIKDTIIFSSK